MKLSETSLQDLEHLSFQQISELVYGGVCDDGESADVALLLGSRPAWCHERALKAAELYQAGRVTYIMPTGGVEWEYNGEQLSEAQYMRQVLLSCGVPDEAIILENEARTTKENLWYSTILINRRLRLEKAKRICIVTSANHLKRSMALAKQLLPRFVRLSGCPATLPDDPVAEIKAQDRTATLRNLRILKSLVDDGLIDDIEYQA